MTRWTRSLRIPSSQRHWIATLHTALNKWARSYWKRFSNRIIPKLERLESIEAPVSVNVPAALLGAAAIVRAADPVHETPTLENPVSLAGIFQTARSEYDTALADAVFMQAATGAEAFSEFHHVLAGMEHLLSEDDAAVQHQVNERILDPVTTALNAMLDPLANPPPTNEATNAGHGPSAPTGNGTPPNQAGAYGGGGQGAAGPSTPFAGGGGGSPVGAGGGNGAANQLNTLGIQGLFSPAFASNATAAQPQAQVASMLSPSPIVSFSQPTYNANESDTQATIAVTLSAQSTQDVTVQYQASPGSAVANTDFTPVSSTLTIPAGQNYATFNVPILNDANNGSGESSPDGSADETVNLLLSNPVNATLGSPNPATLDLAESTSPPPPPPPPPPPMPTVEFVQGSDLSTQETAGQATIFVQLSAAASAPVNVQYATSNGSAIAGTDYTTTSGMLTFPTGTTQESFNVPILDDNLSGETSPETVDLTLSNPNGATLGNPNAVVLDINEDSDSGSGPPLANNDSYSVPHDTTLSEPAAGVLANDTDPNQLPLSAVLVSNASHGVVNLNSDGSFTYTPNAGYTGSDSFTYYASDGQQNSNTATVSLSVTDSGTLTTQTDNYNILHDQVLNVDASTGVLANDSDSDGDALTASIATQPSNGNVIFNSDGSFMYTPNVGYIGTDSFQYTASDGVQTSNPTTVNITVTDQAPTAVNQSYGIPENTIENVTAASGLLKGASDADGDALTASASTQPSHGTLAVNSDGSFTYTPTTGYTGSDSFTYTASDSALTSNTATVSLNVHGTDGGPTANATSYSVLHDRTLTETAVQGVLNYASDADGDPLTANLVGGSGPSHGTLTLNNDGSFAYTPTAGYTGSDRFQYTASDGSLTSSAATVTLTITNSGAPVANADSYSVERNNEFDADASTGVLANDTDSDGDTLTASAVSQPTHGTLTLNSDGSFSYTPTSNYTGTDSFTYTTTDGVATSSPATVTLTVSSSPPVANDDTYYMLQNTSLTDSASGVLADDYDPDNLPITAVATSQPSYGSLTFNSDGSFTYTPISGYTGTDSFTYTASDGSLTSNTATVTINVFASDSPPTTVSQQYTVSHNGDLTSSGAGVLAGASDPNGQPLAVVLDSDVQNGYLTLNPDGSFEYAPAWDFVGDDSFTYHATDGLANSASTTVTIHVTNQAPTLANPPAPFSVVENASLSEDQPVLLSGAYDADGDEMMTTLVSGTTNGTLALQPDGSFSYDPNTAFIGTDSFTYEITDGLANSSPIPVTIQVQPGSPFQLDGRDAGSGAAWMSDTEAESDGIYVSASDPNPAALLAHATGNPAYQRTITWNPTQLSITAPGHSDGSSGSLTLVESDGDVQLTVVPVRAFAPGESANISMAVQDVQTQQQVAFLAVNAVQVKAGISQVNFTSDQGLMRSGNLDRSGALLGPIEYQQGPTTGTRIVSNAVSQQADKPIAVTLTLNGKGIANGTAYTLTGTSKDDKALTFSSAPNAQLTVTGNTITASATAPAPGSIRAIKGNITWKLTLNPGTPQAENVDLGKSAVTGGPEKHRIYTTLGTPNTKVGGTFAAPDGWATDPKYSHPAAKSAVLVTEERMRRTVEYVSQAIAALNKTGVANPQPSQIVAQLVANAGVYSLTGANIWGVKAWGVPDQKKYGSPCIALAEFVSLVSWMTGMPGTLYPTTYYALPNAPTKALVGAISRARLLPPATWLPNAKLLANGQKFAMVDRSNSANGGIGGTGGLNNFEATVVYAYTDPNGKVKTAYFPAGTKDPLVWDSADKILYVFRTLAIVKSPPKQGRVQPPAVVVKELHRYTTLDTDRPPNMKLP